MDTTTAETDASEPSVEWGKVYSVGVLNMAQTFPATFIAGSVATIFRDNGLPLDMFWLFSIPLIPYWFKWFWSPFIDRFGNEKFGFRKSWVVPCTILAASAYFAAAMVQPIPEYIFIMVAFLFCKSVIMSIQDVAVDAYTIEALSAKDRPTGAAVITVLRAVADLIALVGLLALYDYAGWAVSAGLASLLLIVFSLPVMIRKEPVIAREKTPVSVKSHLRTIWFAISRIETRYIIVLQIVVNATFAILATFSTVYAVDRGLSLTEIGMSAAAGYIGGILLGNMIGAKLIDLLDAKTISIIAIFLALFTGTPMYYLTTLDVVLPWQFSLATFVAVAATAPITLLFRTYLYKWPSKAQAATDYAVWQSFNNIGQSISVASAGFIIAAMGWGTLFLLVVVGYIISASYFYFIFDRVDRLAATRQV